MNWRDRDPTESIIARRDAHYKRLVARDRAGDIRGFVPSRPTRGPKWRSTQATNAWNRYDDRHDEAADPRENRRSPGVERALGARDGEAEGSFERFERPPADTHNASEGTRGS